MAGVEIMFSRKNDIRLDRKYDKTADNLAGQLVE
jgi:hypothetical protein